MEVQGVFPVRFGRFLGYLAVGLVFTFLLAVFLEMAMPWWFLSFSAALSAACFFAIGALMFFLGGHIYGSIAGMWASQGGLPVSGMFAMRAAGEDKLNQIQEEDWRKTNNPSRERVLTLVTLALIFLALSAAVATVPVAGPLLAGGVVVVVGLVLLDRGVRWSASR